MDELYKSINEQVVLIREYHGSPIYRCMVELLDLLGKAYDEDFRTIKPEALLYKQGASRQLVLLRDALLREHHGDIPKV